MFWWYPEESNLDARRRKHQKTSCYQVLAAQNPDICLHLTHKVMNFQKVNDTESRIFLNLQCYTFQTTQDSLLIGKKSLLDYFQDIVSAGESQSVPLNWKTPLYSTALDRRKNTDTKHGGEQI